MSFLHDYLEYSSGNECPQMFHVWAAYSALATTTARRIFLPEGHGAIYPNLYILMVGDAGNGKSVALKHLRRLLVEAQCVTLSPSITTPEGFIRYITGDPETKPPTPSPVAFQTICVDGKTRLVHPAPILANEFVNFIAQNPVGWINLLTDIYDEDCYSYQTKNKGTDILMGPYINLFGCLTTEISSKLQQQDLISTGLARRTLFQYGERNFSDPHPYMTFNQSQAEAYQRCLKHLQALSLHTGPMRRTTEAEAWWSNWYCTFSPTIPASEPNLRGWYSSKGLQLTKLAMLSSLAESFDMKIDVRHYEVSLAFLAKLEETLSFIFGGAGRNELAMIAQKIETYVCNQAGPIKRKSLQAMFFAQCKPPNDFKECLAYLIEVGRLATFNLANKNGLGFIEYITTPTLLQTLRDSDAALAAQLPPSQPPEEVQAFEQKAGPLPVPVALPSFLASLVPTLPAPSDEIEPLPVHSAFVQQLPDSEVVEAAEDFGIPCLPYEDP